MEAVFPRTWLTLENIFNGEEEACREEIVARLRQIDVLIARGWQVAEVVR